MALVITMHLIILAFDGYKPWQYFKQAYAPLLVAFSTRSSFGTLPVSQQTLSKKFNTRDVTASFVPSMGATLGMNACAGVFPAMLVVMAATILHQPIAIGMVLMVMFINTIASFGISGIPGTSLCCRDHQFTDFKYAVCGYFIGAGGGSPGGHGAHRYQC